MSNTSPIKIVISQGATTQTSNLPSSPTPTTNQTSTSNVANNQNNKKNIFESTVFAGATHVARSAINTTISQYANLTGDYVVGNALQSYSTLLTYGLAVAKGGPIGMVYAAVSIGQSAINEYIKHVKNERELDMMRKRAGFINGGAGLTND
jgi:hypothetical protein